MTDGIVQIHGREYQTVAYRVQRFREECRDWTIETQLICQDDDKVIMKALISNGETLIATGYAEEVRGASNINRTSALENAETSAIGRALAACGLGGTEYATADEVAGAISQQHAQDAVERLKAHNEAWRRQRESIYGIQRFIDKDDVGSALDLWNKIPDDDREALRVSPKAGGWMRPEDAEGLAKAKEARNA